MPYDIEKYKMLCAGYFLNNLDKKEAQELKDLLASNDEDLKRIFNEIKNSYDNISLSPETQIPSSGLKKKILNNIKEETRTNIIEEKGIWGKYKFAFAISLVVIINIIAVLYTDNLNQEIEELRQYTDELNSKLEKNEEKLSLFNTNTIVSLEMEGLEGDPQSKGRLIWGQAETDVIILDYFLPKEKENKIYKLWVFSKTGDPLNAGILTVDDDKTINNFTTSVKLKERYPITGFLITLEDKDSEAPDGERFLGALHKTKNEK